MDHTKIIMNYMPQILNGAWLTLALALTSFAGAFAIGLMGAQMRLSKNLMVSSVATVYSTIVRGVPELVWMFLIYYGFQYLLNDFTDALGYENIQISSFIAGIFALSFIYGAYFTETFRGAMMAIPPGQMEAGLAYGLNHWQVFKRISFPLLMRYALPGVKNNWLVLTKATALVSIIGLSDLTRVAQQAGSAVHLSLLFNLASAAIFLAMTSASLSVYTKFDRQFSRGIREIRYES